MSAFPDSQDQQIRDLQRQVEALANEVKNLRGLVITRASGPFFIPNASSPSAQSGGVVAYAIGGEPAWRSSSGSVIQIPEPFSPASDPGAVPSFSSTNAPGTYQAAYVEATADGLDALVDWCALLRTRLINADILS